jgi:ketosteroid isomerase-like protein
MLAQTPQECDALRDACINGGNLEGLLALYEPGAGLVQQDGSPPRTGAALRQSLAAYMTMGAKITTNVVKAITAENDLAVLYNDWTLTVGGPDGNPMSISGKATEVVRRQPDGTWKFVIDDPFGRN